MPLAFLKCVKVYGLLAIDNRRNTNDVWVGWRGIFLSGLTGRLGKVLLLISSRHKTRLSYSIRQFAERMEFL